MRSTWLALPLLLVSGAAAAQDTLPATTADADRPCAVAGPEYAGWKEVRATGFTFCVPANWRSSGRGRGGVDPRTWRGGSGSITWGTGQRPQGTTQTVIRRVDARELNELRSAQGPTRRFTETIGGKVANLWDNEFDGNRFTGAEWSSPSVYMTGDSRDATAEIQLRVYRTVRFTQP